MNVASHSCPQCGTHLPANVHLACPSPWDGVFLCSACGLASLMPAPSTDELMAVYARSGNWEIRSDEQNRVQSERRARLLEQFVAPGRLFEVGASRGEFLAFMRDRGWQVQGLEPGSDDCAAARDRYGIALSNSFFTPADRGHADMDALVAWDVLEHCKEPAEVLSAMRTWVRPGGVIALAIPNIEGAGARLFGQNWRYRMSPIHVHFFTERWWQQQCARLGLERVQTVGFTKVQAWAQGVLPVSAKKLLIRQMASGGVSRPAPQGAGRAPAPSLAGRLKAGARRAVFQLNQQPVPLPVADLMDVVLRVK